MDLSSWRVPLLSRVSQASRRNKRRLATLDATGEVQDLWDPFGLQQLKIESAMAHAERELEHQDFMHMRKVELLKPFAVLYADEQLLAQPSVGPVLLPARPWLLLRFVADCKSAFN